MSGQGRKEVEGRGLCSQRSLMRPLGGNVGLRQLGCLGKMLRGSQGGEGRSTLLLISLLFTFNIDCPVT